MSSPRKDARWFLATGLVEHAGLESMHALNTDAWELLLRATDRVLNHVPPERIFRLADQWNAPEPNRFSAPPKDQGWFPFGSHQGFEGENNLEFSAELDPEDGLPLWERHVPASDRDPLPYFTLRDLSRLQNQIYRAFPVVTRSRHLSADERRAADHKGMDDRRAMVETLERMINHG